MEEGSSSRLTAVQHLATILSSKNTSVDDDDPML